MNSASSSFADDMQKPLTEWHTEYLCVPWAENLKLLPENAIHISKEEYEDFVDKLNNPPKPNERLMKLMADDFLQQLKCEVSKSMGVPKHLSDIDPRKAAVV